MLLTSKLFTSQHLIPPPLAENKISNSRSTYVDSVLYAPIRLALDLCVCNSDLIKCLASPKLDAHNSHQMCTAFCQLHLKWLRQPRMLIDRNENRGAVKGNICPLRNELLKFHLPNCCAYSWYIYWNLSHLTIIFPIPVLSFQIF